MFVLDSLHPSCASCWSLRVRDTCKVFSELQDPTLAKQRWINEITNHMAPGRAYALPDEAGHSALAWVGWWFLQAET